MKYNIIYLLTILALICFSGCRDNEWDKHTEVPDGQLTADILEKIKSDPELSAFYESLEKTGYSEVLSQANNFTVFAPQNGAWAEIKTKNTSDPDDVEELRAIVSHHITYGKLLTPGLAQQSSIKMLDSKNISYNHTNQTLNNAKIVSANNVTANGVIHIIDNLIETQKSVYEFITSEYKDLKQVKYIQGLDQLVMDKDKSISLGVNEQGQIVYDTVWINHNKFLKEFPIHNEDSVVTYIVLKDAGYDHLNTKYKPYFVQLDDSLKVSDSLTQVKVEYNICSDFVMALNKTIDITTLDTIVNVNGVKIPVNGSNIEETYDASNGKVYVLDKSNILLREKIKPIIIEGEDYRSASAHSAIYVRYKLWASGEKDVMLNCNATQTDSIWTTGINGQDSVYTASKTFNWNVDNRANVINSYLAYRANVNSVDYEIYYQAYDDVDWHYSDTNHIFRLEQKLFISMPMQPALTRGPSPRTDAVINNYLGDTKCFVGQDLAGVKKETKLKQWHLLNNTTQLLKEPVMNDPDSELMKVPHAGSLTMWLCNTTRSAAASAQGMLFLDYIKLVPILPAE